MCPNIEYEFQCLFLGINTKMSDVRAIATANMVVMHQITKKNDTQLHVGDETI